MIVDDRLETVLRTIAGGPAAARTQFRQLVDLLDRAPAAAWSATHHDALERLDSLTSQLDDRSRAALLQATRITSPRLVEHFARQNPDVAIAAIGSARLTEHEWLALIPALPVRARGFLRHRRDLDGHVGALLARLGVDDFALPQPVDYQATAPATVLPLARSAAPASPRTETNPREGIGAIVRRIEAFRRQREIVDGPTGVGPAAISRDNGHPRLPFADDLPDTAPSIDAVDIRIDATGTIVAAGQGLAAMLYGHRPFTADTHAPAHCDRETLRAARGHRPVDAGRIELEGSPLIAGPWRIDATPMFGEGGQFNGYEARLRRPARAADAAMPARAANDDGNGDDRGADRLRQLLHELRTPINAIQGFAELIQQQLFGPTPHQYRALAASIASDAARMLAGFEDVERLVLLESGANATEPGQSDLNAVVARLIAQLEPVIAPREVRLRHEPSTKPLVVALSGGELERTVWRMLAVIAGGAAPGERLNVDLSNESGQAQLSLTLPASLAIRDDEALFAPDTARGAGGILAPAMLGSGFALRLAAAELRAAGGTMVRKGGKLFVTLPLLTEPAPAHSQGSRPARAG
jgi:signal transduction histidine kinase